MNDRKTEWLVDAYECLLRAGALYDCLPPDDGWGLDGELVEAVVGDIDRSFRALERMLVRRNALPEWAKPRAEESLTPIPEDMPF